MTQFQAYLKTLNDSAVLRLYVLYCLSSENDDFNGNKAYDLHEEAMSRDLLPQELYDFDR